VVVLLPRRLHWIKDSSDDPTDLCAHGDVEFRIGDDVVLATDGTDLTLSAAALYLLRTLSTPHTKANPVGDHLFPCCGFAMWDVPGDDNVFICGCPNGEDFEVQHDVPGPGVVIRASDGREWRVEWAEWREAVFAFADAVSEFYQSSSPKQPSDEDAPGYEKFLREWQRRRGKKAV
jgi:hypothetical protein